MEPRVLLLNLDRSPDRYQVSVRALTDVSLAWERVPGVDGALLSEAQRAQLNPPCHWREWFRPLTAGELGCFLGHMRCWQSVVDRQWPWALILEDDFAPLAGVTGPHVHALASQLVHWDVIRLSNTPAPSPGGGTVAWDSPLLPGAGLLTNGTAYMVSQAGARKLLRARDVLCRPVDFDLRHFWERDLRMAATPAPWFRQRSHEEVASLIGDRAAYRQAPRRERWATYRRKYLYHMAFFMAQHLRWARRRV